jgi:hypothetical protein
MLICDVRQNLAMNFPQNLAFHSALLILPLVAFSITWRRVIGKWRRSTLAVALSFFSGIGAWWASGYLAPHPFLAWQRGPMNPDLVFISTLTVLLVLMALIAFVFGGHRNDEPA